MKRHLEKVVALVKRFGAIDGIVPHENPLEG